MKLCEMNGKENGNDGIEMGLELEMPRDYEVQSGSALFTKWD